MGDLPCSRGSALLDCVTPDTAGMLLSRRPSALASLVDIAVLLTEHPIHMISLLILRILGADYDAYSVIL